MEITNNQIGFSSELVPLVKSGEKILTYRLGDKWDFLNPGDVLETKDSGTGEVFGTLEITGKEMTIFKELDGHREGHEDYRNAEERRKSLEKYYQRKVEDTEPVTIIKFKVVELTNQL